MRSRSRRGRSGPVALLGIGEPGNKQPYCYKQRHLEERNFYGWRVGF